MSKRIIVKITAAGSRTGPFNISDDLGNILATNVPKAALISGIFYEVDNNAQNILIQSIVDCNGRCKTLKILPIGTINYSNISKLTYTNKNTASLWRHLTNPRIYNSYYGNIEPYIIEYPFSYQFQDEILQNVKDYTRAYNYLDIKDGVWNDNARIEVDNQWFNKAVVYNGQQSSGILELVPKPMHNLKEYMKYPIYNPDSKVITYTKSDNFYQYNTFWSLVKNKFVPLFETTCCYGLSLDKVVNQANMDYGKRSFKKEPLRAKELKVRHILDNSCTTHLVSQFIVTPAQISYK
jgi:hypothetical protein